jgi:hypothetical protein
MIDGTLAARAAQFCNHEDGDVSRHLSSDDQAAASRRIQQRSESPAFLGGFRLPPHHPRESAIR